MRDWRKKGDHTCEMHLRYHRCPACGCIIESRDPYQYRLGNYVKQVLCPRCGHSYEEYKARKVTLGPLIGEDQPVEIEWNDDRS